MALVPCPLPYTLHIVIEPVRFQRAAQEYPDAVPPDHHRVQADLMQLSASGVPTLLDVDREGEPQIIFCTPHYEIVCALTHQKDGYYAYRISPLSLRNHDQISRHAVAVMPQAWQLHFHVRELTVSSVAGVRLSRQTGYRLIADAWQEALQATRRALAHPGRLSPAHLTFLSHVETLVDLACEVELDKAAQEGYTPVTGVEPVARARVAGDVYRFRLAGPTPLPVGEYVWAGAGPPAERGPGYAGVVTEKDDDSLVVRFHRPVDLARLRRVEWLRPWTSTKQYDIQRDAIRALREGGSLNPHVLPLVVDGRFRAYDAPTITQGEGRLNPAQRTMIARAEEVPDLLLALGPPGTGKTHTIRAVVNQQATQNHKVLITSKNNKAVDNVLEALEGVDALRVGREEAISAQVRPLMIDHKARDKQREILDRTALVLESLDAAESVWPGIQQILAQMVQQAGDWRLAQARFEREMESLGDWQRAQYGNVARAIEGQLRRFQAAHQQVHEAARQAASHSRGIERWSWLCRLPAVGRVFEGRRARLEARWDESARLYRQALRERGRAAGQIQDTWKAYHHAASASEEALRRKGAVAEEEQVLAEVRATAARIVTRLKEMTARFEDAPSLTGAAESPQALEDSRWPLHRWHEALQGRRDLLHDWHELLQRRRQALYPMLLQMADVVGATCIGIATDARFEDLEFDLMIADEAGQIQVMDLLVPLVRARRAVLVGDHRQLPPVVEHEIAERIEAEESELHTWLYQSLFEHLFDRQNAPAPDSHTIMLDTQYRMPRTIADFISAHFYQGRYRTGRDVPHTDPFFDCSLVFVDTRGERQRRERPAVEPEGIRGYTNDLEAELMADLVLAYRARDVQWGVIVPYKKQAERIRQVLCRRHHAFPQDELNDWVATVDSFQGKERDVILYGFTRSNPRGRVGFMAELRRLNVSLTRARHQLVMFGDSTTLARALDAPFAELMQALLTTVNGLPGGYLDVRDYRRKLDR